MHLVLIGLGGFVGAIARYLVGGWATSLGRGTFPWGTMVVNLTGSFIIGVLFALMIERAAISSTWRGPLMIGFVGSYTTFSTLTLESWRLLEDGAWLLGITNLAGSLLVGVAAVVLGIGIGRALA